MTFKLYRMLSAERTRLSPESFDNREPSYMEVLNLVNVGRLKIVDFTMEAIVVGNEVLWLTSGTLQKASKILTRGSVYEAHEGASLTASGGAWVIESLREVPPPLGSPRDKEYVAVSTRLSKKLGLDHFIVEKDFVFYGYKGEDIDVCKITGYRAFLLPYDRSGRRLSEQELRNTLLWKNYLSKVRDALESKSKHLKREWWDVERMGPGSLARVKVVWRDVAKRFIPAIDDKGYIPDYTVNYVVVRDLDEAYYLLSVLLSPQINAVVEELSSWIGHVQPRFLRYFAIPKYNPRKDVHVKLAEIGKKVCEEGLDDEKLKIIESLVDNLQ